MMGETKGGAVVSACIYGNSSKDEEKRMIRDATPDGHSSRARLKRAADGGGR